ncbi:hypothetical protein R1sor_026574 [Riccia sorocarpa]|uniref:Uncharacterized protein n=1 Tax=Riccia sorocarpa TaxID=122646 RepID=A0ABD3GD94_9MARC
MLTVPKTTEERDEILRNPHPPIRGCLIAHFPYTPEMDEEHFQPQLKPLQVAICNIPKWAKEELPRVFMSLGQVLHIPQESREMVRKDVRGTIMWKEEEELPDTILVTILHKSTTCKVRKPRPRKTEEELPHEEEEQLRKYLVETTISGNWSTDRSGEQTENRADSYNAEKTLPTAEKGKVGSEEKNTGLETSIDSPPKDNERERLEQTRTEDDIQQILHTMEQINISQNRVVETQSEPTPDWLKEAHDSVSDSSLQLLPNTNGEWPRASRRVVTSARRGLSRDGRPGGREEQRGAAAKIQTKGNRLPIYQRPCSRFLTPTDSSSKSNIQSAEEAIEFQTLLSHFGVMDARDRAEKMVGPKFTRAQAREGILTWSRLDRLYVPEINVLKVIHHAFSSDPITMNFLSC